ncbi:hypothetical protein [Bradyrhizobium sp. LTSP849]|uniref:hypothetical protein n=1 Tax=Bradyrhizobium sp. LTSP849 TaxID=1615890 RepID=UPI000A83DE45|nr:hypothetical protein [Bradyrhizobium sp. LTSP849]
MAKLPSKLERQKQADEDRDVYNNVVFQDARVMSGPKDMGFLEVSTTYTTFVVIINSDNAEHLIRELQDFLKGRAPHFARPEAHQKLYSRSSALRLSFFNRRSPSSHSLILEGSLYSSFPLYRRHQLSLLLRAPPYQEHRHPYVGVKRNQNKQSPNDADEKNGKNYYPSYKRYHGWHRTLPNMYGWKIDFVSWDRTAPGWQPSLSMTQLVSRTITLFRRTTFASTKVHTAKPQAVSGTVVKQTNWISLGEHRRGFA